MEENVEVNKNASLLTGASKRYIRFIVFYICAYAFVDGYLTAIPIHIQEPVMFYFGMDVSGFYTVLMVASLGLVAVFGLQVLADILGRKPTVLISFVGMATSGIFMAFAQDAVQFTVAFFLSFMFVSTDAWIILVGEDGQKEKRGRIVLWIWIMSVISTITAPILRKFLITGASTEEWRVLPMLLVIALPIALLGLGIKESSAFSAQQAKPKEVHVGSIKTISKVWHSEHRNKLLAFLLAGFYFGLGYASISTYTSFLMGIFGNKDTVNSVFIIMSMCAITGYLLVGPASDRIGRKRVSAVLGVIVIVMTFMLYSISDLGVFPGDKFAIVSIFSGTFFGAYWSFSGLNRIHCLEVFPTEIRGTSSGWRSFTYAMGVVVGSGIAIYLTTVISLGTLLLAYSLFLVPVLIVNLLNLPETKKIDIA
ncbi:MAG: MFS transporter [Candidatus Lokiarchaeota archaeon]|nr:MFS transporter [Candidatus Lokiarchaeota archaeon]